MSLDTRKKSDLQKSGSFSSYKKEIISAYPKNDESLEKERVKERKKDSKKKESEEGFFNANVAVKKDSRENTVYSFNNAPHEEDYVMQEEEKLSLDNSSAKPRSNPIQYISSNVSVARLEPENGSVSNDDINDETFHKINNVAVYASETDHSTTTVNTSKKAVDENVNEKLSFEKTSIAQLQHELGKLNQYTAQLRKSALINQTELQQQIMSLKAEIERSGSSERASKAIKRWKKVVKNNLRESESIDAYQNNVRYLNHKRPATAVEDGAQTLSFTLKFKGFLLTIFILLVTFSLGIFVKQSSEKMMLALIERIANAKIPWVVTTLNSIDSYVVSVTNTYAGLYEIYLNFKNIVWLSEGLSLVFTFGVVIYLYSFLGSMLKR
jgi:hypothetical protein